MALGPGSTLGDFQLTKKLGEGGMGVVFLAQHQAMGTPCVLKVLHEEYGANEEMRARFVREAEAMARLVHPNIVKMYSFLDVPEGLSIAMEFVDGRTFEDLITEVGLVPPPRAVELMLPVVSAVAYAHAQGVIHRDIKPANIMLLKNGEVRVLDFGIAKIADRPGLTRAGMTLGTATYMAPEQLQGRDPAPSNDIYALGVSLYELCTGNLPFEASDSLQFVKKVLTTEPTPPHIFYPPIPPQLEAVILKAIAKRPEDRYQTALEMDAALREVQAQLAPAPVAGQPQKMTSKVTAERAQEIMKRPDGLKSSTQAARAAAAAAAAALSPAAGTPAVAPPPTAMPPPVARAGSPEAAPETRADDASGKPALGHVFAAFTVAGATSMITMFGGFLAAHDQPNGLLLTCAGGLSTLLMLAVIGKSLGAAMENLVQRPVEIDLTHHTSDGEDPSVVWEIPSDAAARRRVAKWRHERFDAGAVSEETRRRSKGEVAAKGEISSSGAKAPGK